MADVIELEIKLEGTEEAIRGLERTNEEMGATGTAAQAASGQMDSFTSGLRGAAGIFAAVTGALAGLTAAAVALGNELERRAGVWNRFHGDLSETRNRTAGLVTELQAMTVANRLASRGIQATGRDLNNILVAALDTSARNAEDFDQVMGRLIEGLGSGSRETLQQFNLTVRDGATATEASTEALVQLETQFGSVSASADTAGGRFVQLSNTVDDMATRFLEAANETSNVESGFLGLIGTLTGVQLNFEALMEAMIISATRWGAITAEIIERTTTHLSETVAGWQALLSGDFEEAAQHFGTSLAAVDSGTFADAVNTRVQEAGDRADARAAGGPEQTTISDRGGGGGGGGTSREEILNESLERMDAAMESFRERQRAAEAAGDAQREAVKAAQDAEEADKLRDRTEAAINAIRVQDEADQDAHENAIRRLEEQKAAQREVTAQIQADATHVLGPAINGLTDALSAIIAGTKSAEEAFGAMLAGFLEAIAQQATLEAIKEFAAALGSFASLDVAGGALHLAAGVAWTAVAVAAGAGAAAVAPSAPAQPASPEAGQGGQQGGDGGTTVFNINGTIISASGQTDRARAAREVGALMSSKSHGRAA